MRAADETQGNDADAGFTVPLGTFGPRMLDRVGRCTKGTTNRPTELNTASNDVDPTINAADAPDRRWSAR